MAVRDDLMRAFPRVANAFGTNSVPGLGSIAQGGKELFDAGQELQCDVNSMIGPFACMHNEHTQIVRNQQVLNDKLDQNNQKLDRILQYLDAHFKAP